MKKIAVFIILASMLLVSVPALAEDAEDALAEDRAPMIMLDGEWHSLDEIYSEILEKGIDNVYADQDIALALQYYGYMYKDLPYQPLIDAGWLTKQNPYSDFVTRFENTWFIQPGREKEVVYSPLLNGDRLIFVTGGADGTLYLFDAGWKRLHEEAWGSIEEAFINCGFSWASDGNLVAVNGVDWQDSEYKDLILESLFIHFPHYKDPANLRYLQDKKYNGKAADYIFHCDCVDIDVRTGEMEVSFEMARTKKQLSVKPFADRGNTMLPLRDVAEGLGATVAYNNKTKEIVITEDWNPEGKTIILKEGSDIAVVDGQEVKMPIKIYSKNGHTMVPLRFFTDVAEYGHYIANGEAQIRRSRL